MLSRVRMLQEMGISTVWRLRAASEPSPVAADGPTPSPSRPGAPAGDASSRQAVPSVPAFATAALPSVAVDAMTWPQLRAAVADCRACGLCAQRQQAVLGVGDESPDWLFIGEGPGAEEDQRGEPFVGQAGQLLDAMLAALGLDRRHGVYIANAVKCRPPGNRTPSAEEMAACRPYLLRQIALLQPRLIVLLGRAAVHAVLGEDGALGAMRGRVHAFAGTPVVVTYHPAYLLRNLPEKAKSWEDLCLAQRVLATAPAAAG